MKQSLLDHYDLVKQARGVAYSNLYVLDLAGYQAQLSRDDQVLTAPRSLLIKRREVAFDRIEFYSKDLVELQAMLLQHRQRIEVMEWVGSTQQEAELTQLWQPCLGYHRQLMRMGLRASRPADDALPPDFATPQDLPALRTLFDTAFDPLTERIPDDQELQRLSQQREILVNRSPTGALRGFMVRVRTGRTHHLKYLFVSAEHRGQHVGEQLFSRFRGDAAPGDRLILWVFPENTVAIRLYQKHGFVADGTVNFIFKSR